jgi:hypothetical protein
MGHTSSLQPRPLLLLSSRPWNSALAERLRQRLHRPVHVIDVPADCTPEAVGAIDPERIFVPHWSHLISESIWGQWPTVIFHMSDLPYGRGGSPLQNLILRGHSSTMLTALRCGAGLDAGDVYLKQPLSLYGSAEEIFFRADRLIELMIERIVREEPMVTPQRASRCCSAAATQPKAISPAARKAISALGTTRSAFSMLRVTPMRFWTQTACGWSSAGCASAVTACMPI